jgi:hypothetical protein
MAPLFSEAIALPAMKLARTLIPVLLAVMSSPN